MLVYDGDCAFCTKSAKWCRRRLPADIAVVPWQSVDLAAVGLSEDDVRSAAWWVEGGRLHRGHRAVARALIAMGGRQRLIGRLLLLWPLSRLAQLVYWWVARNRDRMPGATDSCAVNPTPDAPPPPSNL